MSVTRADVDRIADLARLRLDDGEADRLTGEMNRILEHADRLRAVGPTGGDGLTTESSSADTTASSNQDVRGARRDGARGPDRLVHPPADFAPRFEEEFFVVPPPHGVQAET